MALKMEFDLSPTFHTIQPMFACSLRKKHTQRNMPDVGGTNDSNASLSRVAFSDMSLLLSLGYAVYTLQPVK
jgi:hypothetical protein